MTTHTIIVSVPGMTCGHCEAAVRHELGALEGVETVCVDLASKDVTITGVGLDMAAITAAVDEAGFEVVAN